METLKIIILQNELPQLHRLKELFETLGYTVKRNKLSGKDALTILDKNAATLAILDIQIDETRPDNDLAETLKAKDRNLSLSYNSPHTLNPTTQKNIFGQSRDKEAYIAEDFSTDQATLQSVIGQKELQKEVKNSHGYIFKKCLFIRSNSLLVKLKFEDIIYLEADANYTQVFTTEKKYIIRASMKDLQRKLDDKLFARVHKSFLINLEKIECIQSESIQIAGREIPIGRPQYSWLLRQIKIL